MEPLNPSATDTPAPKAMVLYTPSSKIAQIQTTTQRTDTTSAAGVTYRPRLHPDFATNRTSGEFERRIIKPLPNLNQSPSLVASSKGQPTDHQHQPWASGKSPARGFSGVSANPFPSPPKSPHNPSLGPKIYGDAYSSKRRKGEDALGSSKRQRKEGGGRDDEVADDREMSDISEMGDAERKRNEVERHVEHKAYLKRQIKERNAQISVLTQRNKEQIEIQRGLEVRNDTASHHITS